MGFDLTKPEEWGPASHNVPLHVDDYAAQLAPSITVVDVETDENDKFVGLAITSDGKSVWYFTELKGSLVREVLGRGMLVGHNLKADMHFLTANGIRVRSDQMHYDTMLASYVVNPTKESHGLKDLAKEILSWEWPSYQEMVGKGKSKATLDKQPVSLVANYCGMDCLATFKLYQHYLKVMTPNQKRILDHMEMPISRLLFQMEQQGVMLDVDYLRSLDERFGGELAQIEEDLKRAAA